MAAEYGDKNVKTKKTSHSDTNPCFKEQEISFACLNKNSYNQDKCVLEFENYKTCKSFWNEIRKDRMRRGIVPIVPSAEERQAILKEHARPKKVIHTR